MQDQPDVELPAVIVTVGYPGVPPSQLESEVTRKIEDAGLPSSGIEHINSTVNEGVSTTVINFQFERNIAEAVDDVRDAVTRIRADLPVDSREPVISRVTTAGRPVVTFSVESTNMSDTELSWFVDLAVMPRSRRRKGVGTRAPRRWRDARDSRRSRSRSHGAALGATASEHLALSAEPHSAGVSGAVKAASAVSPRACARPARSAPRKSLRHCRSR